MANITASDVKELREITGCGMMDCKRALVEADGNRDEAVKILREKGLAKAAKKAGRIAAEGIVKAKVNGTNGVIVEINCETDFCAKSDKFLELVETITDTILANDAADVEALKNCTIAGGAQTVSEYMTEKIATIGENMNIRRFTKMTWHTGSLHARRRQSWAHWLSSTPTSPRHATVARMRQERQLSRSPL